MISHVTEGNSKHTWQANCERAGLGVSTSMCGHINRVMCGVNMSAEQSVYVSTTFDTMLAALLLIE